MARLYGDHNKVSGNLTRCPGIGPSKLLTIIVHRGVSKAKETPEWVGSKDCVLKLRNLYSRMNDYGQLFQILNAHFDSFWRCLKL